MAEPAGAEGAGGPSPAPSEGVRPCPHLDPGVPASRTERGYISVVLMSLTSVVGNLVALCTSPAMQGQFWAQKGWTAGAAVELGTDEFGARDGKCLDVLQELPGRNRDEEGSGEVRVAETGLNCALGLSAKETL